MSAILSNKPITWASIVAATTDTKVIEKFEKQHAGFRSQHEAQNQPREEQKKCLKEEARKTHIENMTSKLDQTLWFNKVFGTNDDCDEAATLREEEMRRKEEQEKEENERHAAWSREFEAKEYEKEKKIENARATMSAKEFKLFMLCLNIEEFEEQLEKE